MFIKKFPDIQTIFTDLDLTFSFHQILFQTVNTHVFIFNRLNYTGWTIHFSGLSVVVAFFVCLFVFSLGFTNLKYGDMNKRFPDFLMTLPRTKISRYVFKIPWLWKRKGFPLTFHYDHGKCAPIHWCRGWRLRSTNDVLWYNGLKRHYQYVNHNTIQHNNRFCNPENSVPLFGKESFPDSFHKVLWCPSYLVSY